MHDSHFFSDTNFMPHGHCYLWRPDILWMNALSDGLIFMSYMVISITLMIFLRRTPGLPYRWVTSMFSSFIFLCGITHLMALIVIWNPLYFLDGLIKAITAAISIVTGILFLPIAPRAFKFITEKADHETTDPKDSKN
jgi:two-component system NtrC family sensor kinase